VLGAETWSELAPRGKEVDAIYGDLVLRNAQVVAVIADAVPTRHANLSIRNVGGCLIDVTTRDAMNDQFGALYPAGERELKFAELRVDGQAVQLESSKAASGKSIEVEFEAAPSDRGASAPDIRVVYRLADGDEGVGVVTTFTNSSDDPLSLNLTDAVRVDGDFKRGVDESLNAFWAYDRFWKQAYCLAAASEVVQLEASDVEQRGRRARPRLRYGDAQQEIVLSPGKSYTLTRRLYPARDEIAAKAKVSRQRGVQLAEATLEVVDVNGPVRDADVFLRRHGEVYGAARTDSHGALRIAVPPGAWDVEARHSSRGAATQTLETGDARSWLLELPACGYVAGNITDGDGAPVACKIDFASADGGRSPNFGPDTAIYGVRNLTYTPDGRFRAEVRPGNYSILVSHGPEYDAVTQVIEVEPGAETSLNARLVRSVNTSGWISADFHSHSSPSGDNTTSQRGRVLNLLAEHIEFAPCTEHNRISTYTPHLKALRARSRMATCSGIEVTGLPLPLNHQNAFPLVRRQHTQNGGGPTSDPDPVVQIERLAMWDDNSDKLVQVNHPNIPQMFGDRDLDGRPDGGFVRMFGFMDVMEVHPPGGIFERPERLPTLQDGKSSHRIFHWLQLLNLGYRVPGVVNTDAHYTFHGSGFLRNYLRSSSDDPGEIDPMEMVHAAEHGRIMMTNGPYLEVGVANLGSGAAPVEMGDELAASDGAISLHVRVQCANWLDVNRVQVFVNGAPEAALNFTRRTHGEMFQNGVVKFEQVLPLRLTLDAHVIVAVANEGATLGRVMGPDNGRAMPVAVSNPIYVDVDGGGFQPNGDQLGLPLPVEANPGDDHPHPHPHPHDDHESSSPAE